jgi:hypothetical protein
VSENVHRHRYCSRTTAIGVAAGAAVGGVLVADRVVGIHDSIALVGVGYLVCLGSYHAFRHVSGRRRPAEAGAGDVDVFSAFVDALHEGS